MLKKDPLKIMAKKLTRLKKRTVLGIAIFAMGLLFGLSKGLYSYFERAVDPDPKPIPAQTIRVKAASMPKFVETVGALTADTELRIKAGVAGKVRELLVDSGSKVKEGTLLASMIGAPDIRAPFDGYLTDWQVKADEYVSAGTALVELVNTDILSLTYKVPESYASELAVGQVVEGSVKALEAVDHQDFSGIVRFLSPIVDRKTYTILVRATVKNPSRQLWPGMSAHVRHILKVQPNALVIPEACLILTLEGYEVLMILDGKVQKRSVKIGERRQGRVVILSGLQIGDPVILTQTEVIEEGSKAVPHDWVGDW